VLAHVAADEDNDGMLETLEADIVETELYEALDVVPEEMDELLPGQIPKSGLQSAQYRAVLPQ